MVIWPLVGHKMALPPTVQHNVLYVTLSAPGGKGIGHDVEESFPRSIELSGTQGLRPESTGNQSPFPWRKPLLLAEQEGAIAAAFPGSATVVDHAVGDKPVVARGLPYLNIPLTEFT